jgi:hypothetical protein
MSGVFIYMRKLKVHHAPLVAQTKKNHQTKVVELKIYFETAPM